MQDTNLDHRRAAAEDPIGGVIRRGAGDNGVPASTTSWPFEQEAPKRHPLMADEGFPVSGDAIRAWLYDSHETHPFRMPELLWASFAPKPDGSL
jgi:hypothetical protein